MRVRHVAVVLPLLFVVLALLGNSMIFQQQLMSPKVALTLLANPIMSEFHALAAAIFQVTNTTLNATNVSWATTSISTTTTTMPFNATNVTWATTSTSSTTSTSISTAKSTSSISNSSISSNNITNSTIASTTINTIATTTQNTTSTTTTMIFNTANSIENQSLETNSLLGANSSPANGPRSIGISAQIRAMSANGLINMLNSSGQPSGYSFLSGMTPLNARQLNSTLRALRGNAIKTFQRNFTVPYGAIKSRNRYARAGNTSGYLVYADQNVTYYNISISKAVPEMNISAGGLTASPNSTVIVHYPVIKGKTTYNVTALLSASLLANNTANFTYYVDGNPGSLQGNSVNRTISLNNIPTSQNTTIRFDTSGNQNYTAVDPTIVFVPVNILLYIPITLTNVEASTAYPANAQVEITFNALKYNLNGNWLVANLINGEFFYANDSLIPSWLEGNSYNEYQNTNLYNSNSIIYWVRIAGSKNFLSAGASNTIYLGFTGNTITPANTLMALPTTGEAPWLSTSGLNSYGALDNGNYIFINYWDFKGATAPAGWSNGVVANAIFTNGIDIIPTATTGTAYVFNSLPIPTGNIIESDINLRSVGEGAMLYGATGGGNTITSNFPLFSTLTKNQIANAIALVFNGVTVTKSFTANFAHNNNVTVPTAGFTVSNFIGGVSVQGGVNSIFYVNATPITFTATNVPNTGGYYIEFLSNAIRSSGTATFTANWVRIRAYPPLGAAASVSFPAVASTFLFNPNPPAVSNVIIDVGQITVINTIISGNGIMPITGNWMWLSPNSFFPAPGQTVGNTITSNILIGAAVNSVLIVNAFSDTNMIFSFNTPGTTTANTFYANALGTNYLVGTWTFNAVALDAGTNAIETNAVSITVYNTLVAKLVGNPAAPAGIDSGNTITLNAFVTGGTGTFTYTFYFYNSITNAIINTINTGSTNSFTLTTNSNLIGNTINANVQVTDTGTTTHMLVNSILVGPYTINALPKISLVGTPSAPVGIDAGNTITFNALVSGGTGPYTYTFKVYNSITNAIINTISAGSTNSFTFTTNANLIGNTINANVQVSDGDSNLANSVLVGPYTVNTATVTISIVGTPSAPLGIDAGNTITFNALVSGGTGPYTYTFKVYNSITNAIINTISAGSTNSFTFTTNANLVGNTLNANVFVTDGDAQQANSVLVGPYTINTAVSVSLTGTPSAPATIVAGNTITFNAFETAGTGPYTYTFYVYNSVTNAVIYSTTGSSSGGGVTAPSGVLYYIPINVMNQQSTAVSANTPIAIGSYGYNGNVIGFNALKYSQYYTCNLNNAEFFFANGTVATSWLEGNMLNEQTANSACTSSTSPNALVNSANVLYWVLDPSKYFLTANSGTPTYNTIYLGWAGNVISATNNLLSSTLAGEAPQLSCAQPWNTLTGCGSGTSSYGYYDTGNIVFNANGLGLYQNFAGSTVPSGWTKTDPTALFAQGNGIVLTNSGSTVPSANFVTTGTSYGLNPNQILDILVSTSVVNTGDDASGIGYFGSSDLGGGLGFATVGWQLSGLSFVSAYTLTTAAGGTNAYHPPYVNTGNKYVLTTYWPSSSTSTFYDNYNTLDSATITATIPATKLGIGIEWSSGTAVGYVQWIRSRGAAPNEILPNTTYGAVAQASSQSTNSFIFTTNSNLIGNTLNANVFVTDGDGKTANSILLGLYTVGSTTPTISLAGTPSAPVGIDAGNTITFNALVSGGTGPYTYTFYVYNSITNAIINTISAGSTNSFIFTTNTNLIGNTINANVAVTATVGGTANSILVGPYTVNTATVTISLAGTPSAPAGIIAGSTITFNALVSGGTGPYTYTFYVYNSITNAIINTISAGSTNSFIFTTNTNLIGNTLNANVFVTDGDGNAANSILVGSYTVSAATPLGSVTIFPSNPSIDNGNSVTFTSNWVGGMPPYSATLYSSATSACSSPLTLVQQQTGLSSNSVTYAPISLTANTAYCVFVADNSISPTVKSSIATSDISSPFGVAFAPNGQYAYVTNYGSSNIVIINTATNTIVNSINSAAFSSPTGVAFSPNGQYAYAVNFGSQNVLIISTATNTVVNSIVTASLYGPFGVAFSPYGTYAYVTNFDSSNTLIISTATNTVVNVITSGFNQPKAAAFSPGGAYAYVTNWNANNAVIVSTATNTVVNSINNVFNDPAGVAVSLNGQYAYIVNYGSSNVVIVGTGTETANSIISNVVVNPVPTISLVGTPSAPAGIDSGNTITFNALVSGGTGPYTYTFKVYNSITNAIINTISAGSTNSFTFTTNANLIGNTINANVQVSDGDSNLANSVLVGPYTVNTAVSVTMVGTPIAPNNIYAGNPITFNALAANGVPSYTYTFYIYNSITNAIINSVNQGATNSFVFVTNTNLIGNTLNANVFVTDADGRPANSLLIGPYTVLAQTCTFTVSNSVVNFGTLGPGTNFATNAIGWNSVQINNGGTTSSNVMISGSNWNYGANTFSVANTVWSWASGVQYTSANALSGTQTDTLVQIGSGGGKGMYFGIGVPDIAGGQYAQTVNIISVC